MERRQRRQLALDEIIGGVAVDGDVLEREGAACRRPAIDEASREGLRRRSTGADGERVAEREIATGRRRSGGSIGGRRRRLARGGCARASAAEQTEETEKTERKREGRARRRRAAQIIS
jgi:hypothetical protein